MSKTDKSIKIEQTGSPIRRHHTQRATLIGLGLNRIGRVAQVPDTPQTRAIMTVALMAAFADGRNDDRERDVRLTLAGYTVLRFTYDQGRVTGWTGKSGPIDNVLWTRETSGKSRGRKAVLKSAYLSNAGYLNVTVELSSSVGTGWGDATYTAKGGYRQTASNQGAQDLAKGEKTLAYLVFEDAKFGGVMHLEYYDADGTSQGDWSLDLPIK